MKKKQGKTTGKKITKKTTKAPEKVVFAFRLTLDQRKAIHQAAGPRGASQFVLDAALAAAAKTQK